MALTIEHLKPGDAEWLVAQHRMAYARDEGFDASFGEVVAGILADFEAHQDPSRERGFIAWEDGARLGSVFCVRGPDPETAKLRLFYLVSEARGKGLGLRLLNACTDFAREAGYTRMVLWTHESHRAACALYRKTGWQLTRSEPVTSFGVELVEQTWERTL